MDYQIQSTNGLSFTQLPDPITGASVTYGDSFLHTYTLAQTPRLRNIADDTSTIDNTHDTLSAAVSDALTSNQAAPGPTGGGTLMIVQFQAVGKGVSALTFVSGPTGTFLSNTNTHSLP